MRSIFNIALAALLMSAVASNADASSPQKSSVAVEDETTLGLTPVTDGALSESRGAFTPDILDINNAYQNGNSSGNTSIGGVTGNNFIKDGSFSNTQGLVNVIQNSGNNVLIQSSTIVNMTMIGQ